MIKEWRRDEALEEEYGVKYPGENPMKEADDGSET